MDHVGRIIGERYELVSQLGEGGMGAVFRAHDRQTRRTVACKLLQPDVALDPVQVDRFRREFAVLKELEHPALVRLLDGSFTGPEPYLVFELVEGRSLEAELGGKQLALHQALLFAVQLAEAVGVLHAHKVVHRDLKPTNVMVRPDGSICLLDFGIAKHYGDAARTLDRITSEGYVVGTPQYMPPEGLFGGAVTPAYDVWSLGVMFYEMITAQRPYQTFEHSVPELASALMAGEFKPPSHLVPNLPKVVDSCVESFLAARPEQRPASGAEARAALRELDEQTLVARSRSGSGTVQLSQVGERSGRHARKEAKAEPRKGVKRRMSAPTPPPSRKARLVASGGAALLVLGGLLAAFKPGTVMPSPSPSPSASSAPSVAPVVESEVEVLRRALRQVAAQSAPSSLEEWLVRSVGVKQFMTAEEKQRVSARLQSALVSQRVHGSLKVLLDARRDAAALLDSPEDRQNWARAGWVVLLDYLADYCKLKWPYGRRMSAEFDRVWPDVSPDTPVDGTWKHVILRAVADRADVRFVVGEEGTDPKSAPFTFKFPMQSRATAARVWFASKNISPDHALVVRINGQPPLVMRPTGGPAKRGSIRLKFEALRGTHGGSEENGSFRLLEQPEVPEPLRVYFGRDVPAQYFRAGDNEMEVEMIALGHPGVIIGERPTIWVKIISYK